MKKCFCLLLAVLMLCPVLSMADDPDPIIGVWYLCVDINDTTTELIEKGYTYSISILQFSADGQIVGSSVDFKPGSGESQTPSYLGKWEKDGNQYKTSLIGNGIDKAFFEDGVLYVAIFNQTQYYGFRKMQNFDIYWNIIKK